MRSMRVLTYNVRYFGHATRGIASTKSVVFWSMGNAFPEERTLS